MSSKRAHRATYATDKRQGGYLVRVSGPSANRFVSREVPVTRKDGAETNEKLLKLLWTGKDQETGEMVALYTFQARPKDFGDEIPF